MSLKSFHIVFITLSTLLAFGFGAWSLSRGAGGGYTALGAGALALGIGLIVYGVWFLRKIRALAVLAVLSFLGSREALACSVCYGAAEGSMIDAARLGVWLLFGLVFCLQLSIGVFFVLLWKRARNHRQDETVPS